MAVARLWMISILAFVGCQTSSPSPSTDSASAENASIEPDAPDDADTVAGDRADATAQHTGPIDDDTAARRDAMAAIGDPVVTSRMEALIQPRDTPVVEAPESESTADEDEQAEPDRPGAYQGNALVVSIDDTRTTRGRMGKYGQIWMAGDISPTPRVRVQVTDGTLGEVTAIEIVIHRVVAGIVSRPDFYIDERVKDTMRPGVDMTLSDFDHFFPDGGYERVDQLPPGAYRMVVLVLTRLPEGGTSWDRQLIDAVVPDVVDSEPRTP